MLCFFLTHCLLCLRLSKLLTPQHCRPAPGIAADSAFYSILTHTAYLRCALRCICQLHVVVSRQSLTVLPDLALHASAQVGTLSEASDCGLGYRF